jgi:hypothetical protein
MPDLLRRSPIRTIYAPVQLPITASTATCKILHLVLGPLDLDLLGLHVHLNKVVLDITANQGPGELLGNLLCALSHLLDGGLPSVLSNLLTAVERIRLGARFARVARREHAILRSGIPAGRQAGPDRPAGTLARGRR